MTGPLYGLGRFCTRHRLLVLAAWLVVVVGVVFAAKAVGENTSDNLTLPGTDSQRATDVLNDRFPEQANGSVPIVLEAPSGKTLDAGSEKTGVENVEKVLKNDPAVSDVVSPLSSSGSAQLSSDKRIGYLATTLRDGPSDLDNDTSQRIYDEAHKQAKASDLKMAAGGYLGQDLSKPGEGRSEAIGLGMAVIVLLLTFGTFVAMGLPIITAIIGLATGLSLITLLSQVVDVPTVGPTLATMIGLGVGIDYALFIVTRHRTHLAAGTEARESIARATATSGGAVVFAGTTVIIALCSLAVARIPLVSALGYSSAVAVAVAVVAAITLLPAVLAVLGMRINSLKLPLPSRWHDGKPHGWAKWAGFVARRPWPALLLSLAVLALLAAPVLGMHLGQNDVGALPKDTTARQAYDLLAEGFGPGQNGPLAVVVSFSAKATNDQSSLDDLEKQQKDSQQQQQDDADKQVQQLEAQGVPPDQAQQQVQQQQDQQANSSQAQQQQQSYDEQKKFLSSTASDPRLVTLENDMKKVDDVKSVSNAAVNDAGTAAVISVVPKSAPIDSATETLVSTLRDTTIPKAEKGQGYTAYVGGTTAGYIDLADQIGARLPLVIIVVVGLSFLVLLVAFRSVAIPITAGVMNLISVGASFGVVTFIFEDGHGTSLIGLEGSVPIVSFVPLMMFAILFGLSMDYEVFLMTQIREHWQETGDNRESVVRGLATTGRVITSAALIMVSVFCAFILSGDPTVKQFGVGMAVAVAIDATLVRCVLVPAVMVLFGKANWWMPHWLDRVLPNFSIEGDEWFRERDAAAAAQTGEAQEAAERGEPERVG
jgi:RND superfamily putative drug exporter